MPQKTTKIELTPDELRKEREAAATRAARQVFDELKEEIEAYTRLFDDMHAGK